MLTTTCGKPASAAAGALAAAAGGLVDAADAAAPAAAPAGGVADGVADGVAGVAGGVADGVAGGVTISYDGGLSKASICFFLDSCIALSALSCACAGVSFIFKFFYC